MKSPLILFATVFLSGLLPAQQAQPNPKQPGANPPPADSGILIRTESSLVLVDSVVTDKKGNYITDLKVKDFKVSEDGKEQAVKSFSYEADPANSQGRTHYLVLLFDNASMSLGDQATARQAAAKFIDHNAGPDRLMSVVNFGGEMKVLQNFTSDAARLKAVVSGTQVSSVRSNASSPGAKVEADFAARDLLQSLRSVSKNLASIPGRKILVLFTAGFPLTQNQQAEATATISECNRDNVAVYPVDVRGLSTEGTIAPRAYLWHSLPLLPSFDSPAPQPRSVFQPGSVFQPVALVPRLPFAPQRGGAAPGGGGASSSSGASSRSSAPAPAPAPSNSATTSKPGATSTTNPNNTNQSTNPNTNRNNNNNVNNNNNNAAGPCVNGPNLLSNGGTTALGVPGGFNPCAANQALIPKLPPTATSNQQIMYMLAEGTGGFVIANSNDLIGGLEKIGQEQNQYYILGYTPPEAKEGACHTLKVKVARSGTEVRARTGYCSAKPMDVLTGTPVVKGLEAKLADPSPGKLTSSMRVPYFYTASNIARVNLAMEISPEALKFEKRKGALHSEVNFLGIAYTPQGTVAARFSDTLKLDFTDKDDAEKAKSKSLHYENQFDIASGNYTLKVVYTEGDSYGKLEMPLSIAPYSSDALAVSGLALSKTFHRASELGAALDVAMLEDRTPLIAEGLQFEPTGNPSFAKSDLALFYVEMYEPLLISETSTPADLTIRLRVTDRKGDQKLDSGTLPLDPAPPPGNQVVHFGGKIPASSLPPGAYKLELTVGDATNKTAQTTADFDIQ